MKPIALLLLTTLCAACEGYGSICEGDFLTKQGFCVHANDHKNIQQDEVEVAIDLAIDLFVEAHPEDFGSVKEVRRKIDNSIPSLRFVSALGDGKLNGLTKDTGIDLLVFKEDDSVGATVFAHEMAHYLLRISNKPSDHDFKDYMNAFRHHPWGDEQKEKLDWQIGNAICLELGSLHCMYE